MLGSVIVKGEIGEELPEKNNQRGLTSAGFSH